MGIKKRIKKRITNSLLFKQLMQRKSFKESTPRERHLKFKRALARRGK